MNASDSRALWPASLDPDFALASAFGAADIACEVLLRHYGQLKNVSEKFHAGLVSEADRESEARVFGSLRQRHPDCDFLGEETGYTSSASNVEPEGAKSGVATWIVDPLDGTTNYVHQFPFFCVSIGLEANGELLLGVVDAPKLGMRFHAVRGGGAFMNGEPIRSSGRSELREALFATGFSSQDDHLEDQYKLVTMAIKQARGVRRAGAAALDLCFVAQGTFDCFWEKGLAPWDTAAGALIAREAGATVTDFDGQPYDVRAPGILAATPAVHGAIVGAFAGLRRG